MKHTAGVDVVTQKSRLYGEIRVGLQIPMYGIGDMPWKDLSVAYQSLKDTVGGHLRINHHKERCNNVLFLPIGALVVSGKCIWSFLI